MRAFNIVIRWDGNEDPRQSRYWAELDLEGFTIILSQKYSEGQIDDLKKSAAGWVETLDENGLIDRFIERVKPAPGSRYSVVQLYLSSTK